MTRPRSPFSDLHTVLLLLPPVLCALGWVALGMVDLPPMPWRSW